MSAAALATAHIPADPSVLAARTLAIRDQVRAMWGDDYGRRILPFRQQIRDEVASAGGPPLAVPPRIAERMKRAGRDLLPLEVVVLVAAAAEEEEGQR